MGGQKIEAGRGALGTLLRNWREMRGRSQLDLSLDASVSQRHLSFIESGRSVPGREKLLDIADALDVPLRERNALLLAAGYAPFYASDPWNGPQMVRITSAAQRMLKQHEPFPSALMDRYWNVLATNEAMPRFFGSFIDMSARTGPRNMLHLMFDPDGMRPFIHDWDRTAASLLDRVRREAVGGIMDDATCRLLDALMAYPGSLFATQPKALASDLPIIPLGFEKDGVVLNYFSIISTLGAPTTVTAQELRIESMFPADDETEVYHLRMFR